MSEDSMDMGRLNRMDLQISNLSADISQTNQQVSSLATHIEGLAESVKDVVRTVNNLRSRSTDWGVVLTGIGVILAIGAATLAPLYSGLSEVKYAQSRLADRQLDTDKTRWTREDDHRFMQAYAADMKDRFEDVHRETEQLVDWQNRQDERIRDLETNRGSAGG